MRVHKGFRLPRVAAAAAARLVLLSTNAVSSRFPLSRFVGAVFVIGLRRETRSTILGGEIL